MGVTHSACSATCCDLYPRQGALSVLMRRMNLDAGRHVTCRQEKKHIEEKRKEGGRKEGSKEVGRKEARN